jgi:hypothetical protein
LGAAVASDASATARIDRFEAGRSRSARSSAVAAPGIGCRPGCMFSMAAPRASIMPSWCSRARATSSCVARVNSAAEWPRANIDATNKRCMRSRTLGLSNSSSASSAWRV